MALATDPNLDSGKLSPTVIRMLELRDEVRSEWVKRARQTLREAEHLSHPVLINTFPSLYGNIAEAITLGCPGRQGMKAMLWPLKHGDERERLTNNVHSVISEYPILRWAIVDVLMANGAQLTDEEFFLISASIDESIQEAVNA